MTSAAYADVLVIPRKRRRNAFAVHAAMSARCTFNVEAPLFSLTDITAPQCGPTS